MPPERGGLPLRPRRGPRSKIHKRGVSRLRQEDGLVPHRRLGVPQEHQRAERTNGVISDTLRPYANGRKDDWDAHLLPAEFAINNAASTFGDGLTPFFIDRRLALSLDWRSRRRAMTARRASRRQTTPGGCKWSRRRCWSCWRRRRRSRVDTVIAVGDRVLLRTKELLDAADIGKLRPRWDGPFTVTAGPSPNAYTLALPRKVRCSPTVNVDRLKPYIERPSELPPPGPTNDAGQEGEHEVELLLNRRKVRGVTRYLELAQCPERVAEYDAAAPRRRHAARRDAAAPAAAPPPPASLPQHRWRHRSGSGSQPLLRFDRFGPRGSGGVISLAGRGWVRGTVARRSWAAGFSHVVRYGPRSALGAVVVASLLDTASQGPADRWALLYPVH